MVKAESNGPLIYEIEPFADDDKAGQPTRSHYKDDDSNNSLVDEDDEDSRDNYKDEEGRPLFEEINDLTLRKRIRSVRHGILLTGMLLLNVALLVMIGDYFYCVSSSTSARCSILRSRNNKSLAHADEAADLTDETEDLRNELKEKLSQTHNLILPSDTNTIPTKQFAHLHHMKTGGTSMNAVIRCALNRLNSIRAAAAAASTNTEGTPNDGQNGDRIPFYSLSECGNVMYTKCIRGLDSRCLEQVNTSVVMQYCAPLFQMNEFGWVPKQPPVPNTTTPTLSSVTSTSSRTTKTTSTTPSEKGTDIITILRNPIDRVWSMYRFQTKSCYQCIPLLDIYRAIDNGTVAEVLCGSESGSHPNGRQQCLNVCVPQLLNHQTRNLLTTEPPSLEMSSSFSSLPTATNTSTADEQLLQQAIYNMKHHFTLVGITEELSTAAQMIGKVFPWMAETLDDTKFDTTEIPEKENQCALPHANSSPKNNFCGPDNTHLNLPSVPDKETYMEILKHNQLDMKLYTETVRFFQLEKEILGFA